MWKRVEYFLTQDTKMNSKWIKDLRPETAAAATAAKSLQSCPTLCDPIDGSLPGSSIPGILQARALEWAAISSSNASKWKVKVKLLSCVQLFEILWTIAYWLLRPWDFPGYKTLKQNTLT